MIYVVKGGLEGAYRVFWNILVRRSRQRGKILPGVLEKNGNITIMTISVDCDGGWNGKCVLSGGPLLNQNCRIPF